MKTFLKYENVVLNVFIKFLTNSIKSVSKKVFHFINLPTIVAKILDTYIFSIRFKTTKNLEKKFLQYFETLFSTIKKKRSQFYCFYVFSVFLKSAYL